MPGEKQGSADAARPLEEMTPAERSHLHAEVNRATRSESRSRLGAVPSRGPTSERPVGSARAGGLDRRRLAPVLSAAAAILLIATGVALFQHLGGSSGSGSFGAAAPDRGARGANTGAQTIHGGGPSTLAAPAFAPSLLPDVGQVERRGRGAAAIVPVDSAHAPVAQFAPGLLGRLAETAPAALRSQVLECGRRSSAGLGAPRSPAWGEGDGYGEPMALAWRPL